MMKVRTLRLTVVALAVLIAVILSSGTAYAEKSFKYVFEVDDEGVTNVTVFFYDYEDGSSWLLVPKDQRGRIDVVVYEGELLNVTYRSLVDGSREDPFYVIMEFSYRASKAINLTIKYSMKYGALIIEPNAIFVSPRITHGENQTLVITHLPPYTQTSEDKISTLSGYIKNVSITRSYEYVTISAIIESNDRLVVEYTTPREGGLSNITSGRFILNVHSRYIDFAHEVLDALERSYAIYRKVFEVEPGNICVKFFVPSVRDLTLGIKGYVPLVGEELGPIHLNILYIRSVRGFMSLIALHELAHHFLWSINVPVTKLWIHEGVAQYMSLKVGLFLDYHDAVDMYNNTLENGLSKLDNYLGFVKGWNAYSTPPQELDRYYAASYYIVKTLCDKYGGLDYLKRLFSIFKQFSLLDWYNDAKIIRAFGVAADDVDEVTNLFREWGFEVEDSFIPLRVPQIKEGISRLPIWLEPYKSLAKIMVDVAELLQRHGLPHAAMVVAKTSQLIYELSPFLMLVSIAIIGIVIVAMLRRVV